MRPSFELLPFPFSTAPADPDGALVVAPRDAVVRLEVAISEFRTVLWAVPLEIRDESEGDCVGLCIGDEEPEEAAAALLWPLLSTNQPECQ
jgi:hypothetical protein